MDNTPPAIPASPPKKIDGKSFAMGCVAGVIIAWIIAGIIFYLINLAVQQSVRRDLTERLREFERKHAAAQQLENPEHEHPE